MPVGRVHSLANLARIGVVARRRTTGCRRPFGGGREEHVRQIGGIVLLVLLLQHVLAVGASFGEDSVRFHSVRWHVCEWANRSTLNKLLIKLSVCVCRLITMCVSVAPCVAPSPNA